MSILAETTERLWALLELLASHPDQAEAADQRARTIELIERIEGETE